jgi:hypothetical protein
VVGEDAVVAKIRGAGRGVGSGIEIEMRTWQLVKFDDGKVISMHPYPTEADALEAAGH